MILKLCTNFTKWEEKLVQVMNAKCSIHLRNNLAYKEKGGVGSYIKRLQEDL
jgi:hypothetical protein